MITYNDIYEAAENNPLVFFYFPQSIEKNKDVQTNSKGICRQFLIASDEIALLLQERIK
jgi:hypothetical protein